MTVSLLGQANALPAVLAALASAVITSFIVLQVVHRIGASHGRRRDAWVATGGLALGGGICATHYVAVLGVRPRIEVEYDASLLLLSLVVAIAASTIVFTIIANTRAVRRKPMRIALPAGIAILAPHYVGLAALDRVSLAYDLPRVLAATLFAMAAAVVGVRLALRTGRRSRNRAIETLGMGTAIAAVHYVHMSAVSLTPVLRQGAGAPTHADGWLVAAVVAAVAAATILSFAYSQPPQARARDGGGTSFRVLWGYLAFTVASILALTTLTWQAARVYDHALLPESEIGRDLNDVRRLDELSSTLALAAASSPTPEWRARFDSVDREMRDRLARVQRSALPGTRGAAARLARADSAMGILERQSQDIASRAPARALEILHGEEYRLTKRRFLAAWSDASASLEASREARRLAASRRARASTLVAVIVLLLLTAGWVRVIVLVRRHLLEQRQLASELTAARDLAEAANRSKSEFLTSMSHELRTPLTAVIGFAGILRKNRSGRLGPTDIEYVDRIQRSGRHLLSLINQLLDLARFESGRVELEYGLVELRRLVEEAVALSNTRSRSSGVAVRLELPDEPQWVETDSTRLTQVIINLVDNAIKFTERGAVTVRVSGDKRADDAVRIAVQDTGVGIHAERLDAIFLPFEQADNTTARRFGGTGIGLAISRSISDALGGSLTVESTPGAGSTFTLELPRHRRAAAVPAPPEPAVSVASEGSRRLVLVIDDDADARSIIAHQVQEAGADVLLASSGEEGIRLARERRPDAITLDLVMPGLSGVETLRLLKADPVLSAIPVVIVSVGAADAGSLLGAVDSVSKPLESGALASALRRQLGALGSEGLTVLVVEDERESRELLVQLARAAGASAVYTAADGREALVMLESHTPDLVILDLLMPGMGGIAFLRALRLDIRWTELPVIVVTGATLSERETALLEHEALMVLRKGDDIGDRLERVLRTVIPHGNRHLTDIA